MQTRRGFLRLLGIGAVAGPVVLKAALTKKDTPLPTVTMGYCQTVGADSFMFDPQNYVGEVTWETVSDNDPQWWSQVRGFYPPTLGKNPIRYKA